LDRFQFWRFNHLARPRPMPESFYAAPLLTIRPTQAGRQALYYRIAGLGLRLTADLPVHIQLQCLRLLSVLIGTLTIAAAWMALKHAAPDQWTAIAAMAVILFNPQVSFIFSSVNSDILLNCFAACTFWMLFSWLSTNRPERAVLMLGCIAAAILTKRAGLLLLAPAATAALLQLIRRRGRRSLAGTALLVEWIVFTGFLVVPRVAPHAYRRLLLLIADQFTLAGTAPAASQVDWSLFFTVLGKSFLFNAGWLLHPAPKFYYLAWGGIYLATGGTLVFHLATRRLLAERFGERILVALAMIVTVLGAVVLTYGRSQALAQGRYLFPALVPIALLTGRGLALLPPKIGKSCLILLMALDLGAMIVTIRAFHL
ncbi:glycosyltransferase family 39 protein, partial [bacterium]|nr:glycosyltransferase family 39 protein [candidate division CSSED10-310 bacterium]